MSPTICGAFFIKFFRKFKTLQKFYLTVKLLNINLDELKFSINLKPK
jgi:hypothetical protein